MNGVIQSIIIPKGNYDELKKLATRYIEVAKTLPGFLETGVDLRVKIRESQENLFVELPGVFGVGEFKDITIQILGLAETGSYILGVEEDDNDEVISVGYGVTENGVRKMRMTTTYSDL